jgi:predicted RNase H-related nuclease YkuK (DUF458 family)
LNQGEAEKAAEHARNLARSNKSSSIQLHLDKIGESKKATTDKLLK